ncbi:hypothetical protein NOCARDAX2BIS_220153 [Nocardioides sp. AX2bis]|nr:hypothetical protein NOCARDAX2BIS_220153 [Nocardioides sp. AX2bis]
MMRTEFFHRLLQCRGLRELNSFRCAERLHVPVERRMDAIDGAYWPATSQQTLCIG